MFSRAVQRALHARGPAAALSRAATATTTRPAVAPAASAAAAVVSGRSSIHTSAVRRSDAKKTDEEALQPGALARTDDTITVEYPPDDEFPPSALAEGQGRAGVNVYPTLATFSLEGKVGVVTGGARGLGLVMGQGMVISGADLAIVDLNSTSQTNSLSKMSTVANAAMHRGGSRSPGKGDR